MFKEDMVLGFSDMMLNWLYSWEQFSKVIELKFHRKGAAESESKWKVYGTLKIWLWRDGDHIEK